MAKYTKLVQNQAELTALKTSSDFITPNVTLVYDSRTIDFNPYIVPHDYSNDYLTFVAQESGTFKFSENSINYSLDDGKTWTTLASNTDSPIVSSGNKIMFKATLTPTSNGIGTFSSTGSFTAEGNIMSLLYGDDFIGQNDLTGKNFVFKSLFSNCTKLISAENLSLSATILAQYCYDSMFNACYSLTTAPELPATTLVNACYYSMFSYCTSLTAAPELPAIILGNNCYYGMFGGCTSLTMAPELPATTLTDFCYQNMFDSCTSLTIAPELPATTLNRYCYQNMFVNCKSLTTAPVLPATTLANGCYQNMFGSCANLNSITCLAANISVTNCTMRWVNGVSATGTFKKAASMTDWTTGENGIPSGWTVEDVQ